MGGGAGLMPVRRTRSRDLATNATNPRTTGARSVTRPAIHPAAVGADQVAAGTVHPTHLGRHVSDEPHVQPALIPRETFGWEQLPSRSTVIAERSNDYPIRRGGDRVKIIVRLSAAFTTAGELVFYKNDVRFDTLMANSLRPGPWLLDLVTGTREIVEVFDIVTRPGDYVSHEITDAGEGGAGINVAWQLG